MAKRPIAAKQAAKLAKTLRRTPPPRINVVDWLITRKHAKSRKEAHRLIFDHRVRSGDEIVGVKKGVLAPHIPEEQLATLRVLGKQ